MISTPLPRWAFQTPIVALSMAAAVWVGTLFDQVDSPTARFRNSLWLSSTSDQPCWSDAAIHDGRGEILLPPQDSNGDRVLIVSAFGPPQQTTAVSVRLTSDNAGREATRLDWQPRSQPQPFAMPAARAITAQRVSYTTRPPQLRGGATRNLFLPRPGRDGRSVSDYEPLDCVAAASGRRCQMWRDLQTPWDARLERWADQVVALLEHTVLPAVESSQGTIDDLDGSGGVTVVVTDRVREYSSTTPPLCAFVRPTDFRSDLDRPWSNTGDIVYLQPGVPVADLHPVLAHELTHLAQLSWCRDSFGLAPWPLTDWVAEGVAHAAEVQLTGIWQNVAMRLEAFQRHPERCPLVVDDAVAAGRWREPGSRGAACAFGLWCAEQYGPQWWTAWLSADPDLEDRWQAVGGQSLADVYRAWTVSLCVDGLPGPTGSAEARSKPALRSLEVDGREETVTIEGTASAYFRLDTADAATVQIAGPRPARLQVTVVHVPRQPR